MIEVSFIICCHNSAERIASTLRALLLDLKTSATKCEIVIVDNNCTDQTVRVSELILKESTFVHHAIVCEETSGLMAARLRGAQVARGKYIVFVDDDNELCLGWFNEFEAFRVKYGDVASVGSLVEAKSGDYPDWFSAFQSSYACGQFRRTEGQLSESQINYGAVLSIRKDVWEVLETYLSRALDLGRNSGSLGAGDDGLINCLMVEHGYERYYCHRMRALHAIPRNRLDWDYLIGLQQGFGAGAVKINFFLGRNLTKRRVKYNIKLCIMFIFSIRDLLYSFVYSCIFKRRFNKEGCRVKLKSVRARATLLEMSHMFSHHLFGH